MGFAALIVAVSLLQDYPHCLPCEADEQRRSASLLRCGCGQDQEIQQESLQGISVLLLEDRLVSEREVSARASLRLGMWLGRCLVGLQVTLQPS